MNADVTSWGRYPKVSHTSVVTPESEEDVVRQVKSADRFIAYGMGRSYGDVCLNDGGTLLRMHRQNRVLAFDKHTGRIRAEAGLSLATLLSITVPHGWFTPVTPGTKFVTLGGALANDVHGKNHHKVGTFGCHVRCFELLRSDGSRFVCSASEHTELFEATIGGLGLTGVVLWVEVQLLRIASRTIDEESIKAGTLREVVRLTEESDAEWDYTVSWIDVMTNGPALGRGLVLRGRFSQQNDGTLGKPRSKQLMNVPFDAPSFLLSRPVVKVFNNLWYNKQFARISRRHVDYEPFFFPLDAIGNWNRLYGRRGMLQYQCVVPYDGGVEIMQAIIRELQKGAVSSFLAVVKKFGTMTSPGLMSFPQPGVTLTLDMPQTGKRLFDALDRCDTIVQSVGGRVYAAKDARVRGKAFMSMYPRYEEFLAHLDPACSSSFWRRIQSDR